MKGNAVFLLVGLQNSGKTNTLSAWCNLHGYRLSQGPNVFPMTINGRQELVFVISSSKEEQEGHNPERIRRSINKSIAFCSARAKRKGVESYTLVMASNIGYAEHRNKPVRFLEKHKNAALVTAETLRAKGFKTTSTYLRRIVQDKSEQARLDAFGQKHCKYRIRSDENYERQARQLNEIIKRTLRS